MSNKTAKLNQREMDLFRNIYNFLNRLKPSYENVYEVPLSLEETLKVLENAEVASLDNAAIEPVNGANEERVPENECFEASGKVTFVDEHYGMIDRCLYFEHHKISTFKVGMVLQYLAYKKEGVVKISKILFKKDEDWSEETLKESRPVSDRTQVAQVIAREGRTIKLDQGLDLDLNKIESEFIPMVGDWLSLDSVVEVDENVANLSGRILEITKISPLRVKIIEGAIKSFNRQTQSGQINTDVLFFKDVCAPGYVPVVNDKVNAEVIESENGIYLWRALKVLPSGSTINRHYITPIDKEDKEILTNKNEIYLPDVVAANLQKIGERQIIIFEIRNKGTDVQTIVNVRFKPKSDKSQLFLESPKLDNSVMIRPKQSLFFKICCEAKFMGRTKELIIICFEGFNIGRWVRIMVLPPHKIPATSKSYQYKNGKALATQAWKSFQNCNKDIVVGQRPIKPPSFIANKLPSYDIPERFAKHVFGMMSTDVYLTDMPIKEITPCLGISLEMNNYEDVFHHLLYLEEIALQVNMRRYDMSLASMIKDGEFLLLEVPDLSERRPSVIIGDKVIVTDPSNPKAKPLEGHVHKTGKCHVYLKFHPNFHSIYKGEDYSIEFHSSRTNMRRYHHAVDLASRNLGKKILFPTMVTMKDPQISFVCEDDGHSPNETDQEPVIKSKYVRIARKSMKNKSPEPTKPERSKSVSSSSEEAENQPAKLKLEWFDRKLNHFQKAAVKNILLGVARPLPYFIFGPPGTGKTVTLIETILQILRMIPDSRLLVCAPSNSAADLIAIRLLDSGILQPGDLVRMVAYRCIADGSIPKKLVPYCVTGDLAREGSRESRNSIQNGVNTNLQASVLGRHRITVGTCMVVGVLYAMGFPRGHFTHIIVDEAGQATEPELMIPLSLLDVTSAQTVLAGDPMQLGPCVFSLISKEYGLADSYFERVISRFPYDRDIVGFPETGGFDPRLVTRLVYNYRSLPELLTCPNSLFYQNELRATISADDGAEAALLRSISSILPQRKGKLPPALVFHGVRGQNHQTADCPSWFNPIEAGQVFYYINDLYKLGLQPSDIGIITPYIRQGQQVRDLLLEHHLDLPKIGSVEEFQGQEFKIVILSCVRSNEKGAQNDSKYGLGFIASPRRLNVAISRAQALLIIIGNPHLLVLDKYWRNVLNYAVEIGGYTGCDCPNMAEG